MSSPEVPQAQSRTEPPLRPTPVPDAAFGHALLLPLAILIGIALRYLLGLSVAGVALFTIPLALLYIMTPSLVSKRLSRFDQRSTNFMAVGDLQGLRQHLDAARFLRLFAPPALMWERQAQLVAAEGLHEKAYQLYRRAAGAYRNVPPLSVILGRANCRFHLEDWEGAIRDYRILLEAGFSVPTVSSRLSEAEKRLAATA